VKEAETNEQHKSIIVVLRVAAATWECKQITFLVGNCGFIVESKFYTKLKVLDVQEGEKDKKFCRSFDIGMQSARLGDSALPPAGARTCEVNHRAIEGQHCAHCARVRRLKRNARSQSVKAEAIDK